MKNRLFFPSTVRLTNQVTALFDFAWPTAVAMWNLRWQVGGYLSVRPIASEAELLGRFAAGSGIVGANLRRSCINVSWEGQQRQFAGVILIQACALYESWIEDVLESLGAATKNNIKDLQFPSAGGVRGVQRAIRRLVTPTSTELQAAIYPGLILHRKNSLARLDSLMACYRYFKECRNALVHGGGAATSGVLDAYSAFITVATPAALGVNEVPEHTTPVLGVEVDLKLRGVVGLVDVILRLAATIDAELSVSLGAERVLTQRWIDAHGAGTRLLSSDPAKRARQLLRLCQKCGVPVNRDVSLLEPLLRRKRLIYA